MSLYPWKNGILEIGYKTWIYQVVHGVGYSLSEDMFSVPSSYFSTLEELEEFITPDVHEASKKYNVFIFNQIRGKTFAFTGKMRYTRSDLEQLVNDYGGTVDNKVKKSTDYLVQNASNTIKSRSASRLGVKVITEQDFINMAEACNK